MAETFKFKFAEDAVINVSMKAPSSYHTSVGELVITEANKEEFSEFVELKKTELATDVTSVARSVVDAYVITKHDELKGERGEQGERGSDGTNGANGSDGVSATHSWNGTTLTITSASGTSSADLKGERGERGEQGESGSSSWNDIEDKPDTFTPSAHEHQVSEISDFPSIPTDTAELTNGAGFLTEHQSLKTINNQSIVGSGNIEIQGGGGSSAWSDITGKPDTFPPSSHNHAKSEISDFAHTHTKSDVTDFSHTHTKSEITDFPTIPSALSDLTDDSAHRVVTDTEKSTWSGKQDAISSERIGTWNTAYAHSQSAHAPSNAQKNVQSDWEATSGDALILNKPTIPTVPTADITANTNARHTHSNKSILDGITSAPITSHQSLKTINGNSLVGTGNIEISGGGGVPTQWCLLGTTTGTTAVTINTTGYNELLLVHKGQVSATAVKYDTTIINVDDIGSDTLDITMGGISTSSGGYGCNAKVSKTSLAPQWVYNGGSSVTAYTQTWKIYGRSNSMETDLASVLGGGF